MASPSFRDSAVLLDPNLGLLSLWGSAQSLGNLIFPSRTNKTSELLPCGSLVFCRTYTVELNIQYFRSVIRPIIAINRRLRRFSEAEVGTEQVVVSDTNTYLAVVAQCDPLLRVC